MRRHGKRHTGDVVNARHDAKSAEHATEFSEVRFALGLVVHTAATDDCYHLPLVCNMIL